ncbi:MAG TPA: AHH domain-containing protein [Gemmatimonadales bacterium]|nr:AHH domain-containing protein [Gemmatimonadales bacterium]
MTETVEGIAALVDMMEEDEKCKYKPDEHDWTCTLDGDPTRLARNITKHRSIKKPRVVITLASVSDDVWPSQAHHLIPWQQLQKHAVTQWLSDAPSKAPKKLLKPNGYSVDHGNNGKFMPYASDLTDWSGATKTKKRKIVEKLMSIVGIQLHQGPHSYKPYGVGEEGYKTRVGEYLAKIHNNSVDHYAAKPPCTDCKDKSKGGKQSPRRNVVDYMDKASEGLEGDIDGGRIYVSRRAADFVEAGGALGDDA